MESIKLYSITDYRYTTFKKNKDGIIETNAEFRELTIDEAIKKLQKPERYLNMRIEKELNYKYFGDIDYLIYGRRFKNFKDIQRLLVQFFKKYNVKLKQSDIAYTENNDYHDKHLGAYSHHYVIPKIQCSIEDNKYFVEEFRKLFLNELIKDNDIELFDKYVKAYNNSNWNDVTKKIIDQTIYCSQ